MCLIDARRGFVFAGGYDNLNNYFKDQYIGLKELTGNFISYDDFEFDTLKPIVDVEKIVINHNEDGISAHAVKPNYLKITEAEANYEKNSN